jgi:DNA helicase-2/ATP-dependent DNA helicase PcrA
MSIDINQVLAEELTDDQRKAATDAAAEVLCLACAGSGKSRTLAYRIVRLLAAGEPAESIVAFTFTEKAADSIKRRVSQALARAGLNPNVLGAMYIGTIHSYCQNVLGRIDATYRQFDVLDENRLKLYIISRYPQLALAPLRPRARGGSYFDAIRQLSDAWKILNDEMLTVTKVRQSDVELGESLSRLSDCLRRDQYVDFSLMVRAVVDALVANDAGALAATANIRHLMVDEYQDVSPSQEELIRQIRRGIQTLFVVGDDDQSIYAWRGADVSNILGFRQRYPQASQRTLSENFRSTEAIVAASDAFVAAELGASRIAKDPVAAANRDPRQFAVLWFDARAEEAQWVADRIGTLLGTAYQEPNGQIRGLTPADFAILMRSTREPEADGTPRHEAFSSAFNAAGLQFSLEAGGGPFDRPQVAVLRDTFALLRSGSPTREQLQVHFQSAVLPAYPAANFNALAQVMTAWGRMIHTPAGGARRRVYPQTLVYELLDCFGVSRAPLPDVVMRDIGLFSQMIQDVEAVYLSVDSPQRFGEILNFLENAADTGYDVSTDDVLQRPDAVTISTIHKVKGLEYPVVFVVDVEARRFPGDRRSYQGWMPTQVIQPALSRGAYQKSRTEEARLFYTAVTRGERYLYVTGSANLPGGARPRATSDFSRRLNHPEIVNDAQILPAGLTSIPPVRRVDETILPTSFSQVRYYLRCPMDYRFRESFGFSPSIPDLFGFGKTVHTAVEKLHERYLNDSPSQQEAADIATAVFHLKHVPPSRDPINAPGPYERAKAKAVEIVTTYSASFNQDFQRSRQVEARFEIPAQDCVISGAIDLLLKENAEGQVIDAEVIDFKAIEGGDDPLQNTELDWTDLALQVQLYARAAQQVLGENARTGSVHLLKDNQRLTVPVDDAAVAAAVDNVEWAVQGILAADFPMRPHPVKCAECDFQKLCPKQSQQFSFTNRQPALIQLSNGSEAVRSFSQFQP